MLIETGERHSAPIGSAAPHLLRATRVHAGGGAVRDGSGSAGGGFARTHRR